MDEPNHYKFDNEHTLLLFHCVQAMMIYKAHVEEQESLIQIRNQDDFERVMQMVLDENINFLGSP